MNFSTKVWRNCNAEKHESQRTIILINSNCLYSSRSEESIVDFSDIFSPNTDVLGQAVYFCIQKLQFPARKGNCYHKFLGIPSSFSRNKWPLLLGHYVLFDAISFFLKKWLFTKICCILVLSHLFLIIYHQYTLNFEIYYHVINIKITRYNMKWVYGRGGEYLWLL